MTTSRHDTLKIEIATIKKGDRGHSENKKVSWGRLREKLSDPVKDKRYTLPEYLDLSIDKQNRLKDVGSFVGGPFRDGLRKGTSLIQRSIVTLDIDQATAKQIEFLRLGSSDACDYEFFGSTTRKHTIKKPRWRLVFPVTRPLTIEEYAPVARILASKLFRTVSESMDATDDVSYRPAQIMYWPSVCKDAKFETLHNEGKLLDPDQLLEDFGDWRDWTNLPYSELRGQKRPTTGKKAEDPREKKGVIGAFCRAYDVESAIDAYLPDHYVKGDEHSSKPRYTYVHGSSSNGAIVEDDGLFLYSHHGTDPCAERLVNAFDLVRIHLFGELDHEEPEDARATDLPSFREMKKLCLDDENVVAELEDEDYAQPVEFGAIEDDEDSVSEKPKKKEQKGSSDEDETQTEGPDMGILKASRVAAPEFPVDVLGGFWAERAKLWAHNTSAPVDYTAMAILTGAAGAIGNARRVKAREGWTEPCVLWSMLVGDPSDNKSPAMGPLTAILTDIESSWIPQYEEELRHWQSESKNSQQRRKVWEAQAMRAIESGTEELLGSSVMPEDCMEPEKPNRRRAVMTDVTIESLLRTLAGNPKGVLAVRDEMSSWLANMSRYNTGSDRGAWLEAYGGRSYVVDRVKDEGKPIYVRHYSVSMLGGIQPDRLLELLSSADDGLAARFMFAWPDTVSRRLALGKPEDNGAEEGFRRLTELQMEPNAYNQLDPISLPLSKKAWAAFQEWYDNRLEQELRVQGVLKGAFGKSPGVVLRIALVLELLWWCSDSFNNPDEPAQVSAKAIRAAIRLREEYLKPMQMRAFAHAGKTDVERDAAAVASWIIETKTKSFVIRDVTHHSGIPGFRAGGAKKANEAITFLLESGWITPAEKVATAKAGRPKREYKVVPAVFKLAKDL